VKVARDFYYGITTYAPDVHTKWFHELNNPTLTQSAAFTIAGCQNRQKGSAEPVGKGFVGFGTIVRRSGMGVAASRVFPIAIRKLSENFTYDKFGDMKLV